MSFVCSSWWFVCRRSHHEGCHTCSMPYAVFDCSFSFLFFACTQCPCRQRRRLRTAAVKSARASERRMPFLIVRFHFYFPFTVRAYTHTHTQTPSLSHTHSLTQSHTHTRTHTHTHTHTHICTQRPCRQFRRLRMAAVRVRERASERRGVWVGGGRGERGPWSKFVTQVGEGHLVEGVTLPVYGRGVGEGIESEGVREGVC